MIDFLMKQLCQELEIDPPLKPESAGKYIIPFENYSVNITALPMEGVILNTNLGPFPANREEDFLEAMLSANLFGEFTRGGVLGLSDESMMTLNQVVEKRLDYREFRNLVEDFLNTADYWYEEAHESNTNI